MPKLLTKTDVLNGRAQVISYVRDAETFYYRELLQGTKTYRTKKLKSKTQSEAEDEVLDIYTQMRLPSSSPEYVARTLRPKGSKEIRTAIQDYLKMMMDMVEAKQIAMGTYDRAENVLYVPLIKYFEEVGINAVNDINIDTFKGYVVWRQKNAKGRWDNLKKGTGLTKVSLSGELDQIKRWINHWLLPHKLIKAELASTKGFIEYPKINPEDLLANPAINPEDWSTIITYVRKDWIHRRGCERPSARGTWSRNMLYNWMLICKNTGARPEELMKLRWKDVEKEDVGRTNSKGEEVSKEIAHCVLRSSKTGAMRISSCNCVYVFDRWLAFQKEWMKINNKPMEITPNSLVWGCPYKNGLPLSYSRFKDMWDEIRHDCEGQLKGHIFSEERYTIYSMRSTFIEDNLIQGKDIFLIAKAAGHDVKTLMKHYERIDPRKRSREMTDFQYGSMPKTVRSSFL